MVLGTALAINELQTILKSRAPGVSIFRRILKTTLNAPPYSKLCYSVYEDIVANGSAIDTGIYSPCLYPIHQFKTLILQLQTDSLAGKDRYPQAYFLLQWFCYWALRAIEVHGDSAVVSVRGHENETEEVTV